RTGGHAIARLARHVAGTKLESLPLAGADARHADLCWPALVLPPARADPAARGGRGGGPGGWCVLGHDLLPPLSRSLGDLRADLVQPRHIARRGRGGARRPALSALVAVTRCGAAP